MVSSVRIDQRGSDCSYDRARDGALSAHRERDLTRQVGERRSNRARRHVGHRRQAAARA